MQLAWNNWENIFTFKRKIDGPVKFVCIALCVQRNSYMKMKMESDVQGFDNILIYGGGFCKETWALWSLV